MNLALFQLTLPAVSSQAAQLARRIAILAATLLLMGCAVGGPPAQEPPRASAGVLDLRNWDLSRDGPVQLRGQWELYWLQLLTPSDFQPPRAPGEYTLAELPAGWVRTSWQGTPLPGEGFATYRLRIKLSSVPGPLSLALADQSTAYRLWVNGRLVASAGQVGPSAAQMRPQYLTQTRTFQPDSPDLEVVVQVSNFEHREGGLWDRIILGDEASLRTVDHRKNALEVFLCGSLFIMGLYHLGLFSLRRKDFSTLFFGLLCLDVALRVMLTGQRMTSRLWPELDWKTLVSIEYLTLYWGAALLLLFLAQLFPRIPRAWVWLLVTTAASFSLITLFSSPSFFTHSIQYFQPIGLVCFLHPIVVMVRATARRQESSGLILFGLIVLLSTAINDSLQANGILQSSFYFPLGLFSFCFIQSFMLSQRSARAFAAAEKLSTELARMDQLKDAFLANTSHELRTPIHGIVGIAESVMDGASGDISASTRANLALIVQSGRRLASLINDILDFSKMKHEELTLSVRPVDLRSLVGLMLTMVKPLVGSRPLTLVNQLPAQLSPVEADEDRLQQILFNLLGNAIKFTHEGYVTVSAAEEGNWIRLSVTDTGIGIPEDRQARIFEAFEQGDGSISREFGGTGLGLAITRKLVELHGGRLQVSSKVGVGSTFSCTLPAYRGPAGQLPAPAPEAPPAPPLPQAAMPLEPPLGDSSLLDESAQANLEPPAPPSRPSKSTILVVDDEPVNVQILHNQLQIHGFRVLVARDGFQALELIQQEQPDLVLLDLMMPRMNGYEVTLRLREHKETSSLPVVMLTARNQVHDLVQGFQSGVNDYLVKPFRKEELLSRIQAHLSLYQTNRALSRFVPAELLKRLGKESIIDVSLGNNVSLQLTVLFSDIRSFTTLSEAMSPDDNFRFINAYLRRMAPVIARHEGFIDKYIGDAIMALFGGQADDAVAAGVEMLQVLENYNLERQKAGYIPIHIGIGINTGPLMLGIVGGTDRMDGTAIGDAVNLASRLEGMTKQYGTPLLLGENTLRALQDPTRFTVRPVDRVRVKGKLTPADVYEVLEARPPGLQERLKSTLTLYNEGHARYQSKDAVGAREAFAECLARVPEDGLAALHLDRCERQARAGAAGGWEGVTDLEEK